MDIKRALMCTSLLPALATYLSPATALGQATMITSTLGAVNFGNVTTMPPSDLTNATSIEITDMRENLAGTGIFHNLPLQDFGAATLVASPPLFTPFIVMSTEFGHFVATKITSDVPSGADPTRLFDIMGNWTPGTYCNAVGFCPVPLIRSPFPATITMGFNQAGAGASISMNFTFTV